MNTNIPSTGGKKEVFLAIKKEVGNVFLGYRWTVWTLKSY